MGTTIHGYLEIRRHPQQQRWIAAMDIGYLLQRNSKMHWLLFGVGTPWHFPAVAAERGIPEDASNEAFAACQPDGAEVHSPSWITYPEIAAINWDQSIAMLETLSPGDSCPLSREPLFSAPLAPSRRNDLLRGRVLREGQYHLRRSWCSPRDALSGDWRSLIQIMKILDSLFRYQDMADEAQHPSTPSHVSSIPAAYARLTVCFHG